MLKAIRKDQKRLLDAASEPPSKLSILATNNDRECMFCTRKYSGYNPSKGKIFVTPTCEQTCQVITKKLRHARRDKANADAPGRNIYPGCPSCCQCTECNERLKLYENSNDNAEAQNPVLNDFEEDVDDGANDNFGDIHDADYERRIRTENDYYEDIFSPLTGVAIQRVICIEPGMRYLFHKSTFSTGGAGDNPEHHGPILSEWPTEEFQFNYLDSEKHSKVQELCVVLCRDIHFSTGETMKIAICDCRCDSGAAGKPLRSAMEKIISYGLNSPDGVNKNRFVDNINNLIGDGLIELDCDMQKVDLLSLLHCVHTRALTRMLGSPAQSWMGTHFLNCNLTEVQLTNYIKKWKEDNVDMDFDGRLFLLEKSIILENCRQLFSVLPSSQNKLLRFGSFLKVSKRAHNIFCDSCSRRDCQCVYLGSKDLDYTINESAVRLNYNDEDDDLEDTEDLNDEGHAKVGSEQISSSRYHFAWSHKPRTFFREPFVDKFPNYLEKNKYCTHYEDIIVPTTLCDCLVEPCNSQCLTSCDVCEEKSAWSTNLTVSYRLVILGSDFAHEREVCGIQCSNPCCDSVLPLDGRELGLTVLGLQKKDGERHTYVAIETAFLMKVCDSFYSSHGTLSEIYRSCLDQYAARKLEYLLPSKRFWITHILDAITRLVVPYLPSIAFECLTCPAMPNTLVIDGAAKGILKRLAPKGR